MFIRAAPTNIGISYRHADSLYTDNLDIALPRVSSLMLAPNKAISKDTVELIFRELIIADHMTYSQLRTAKVVQ